MKVTHRMLAGVAIVVAALSVGPTVQAQGPADTCDADTVRATGYHRSKRRGIDIRNLRCSREWLRWNHFIYVCRQWRPPASANKH